MSIPFEWWEEKQATERQEKFKTATPEYMAKQIEMLNSSWYPAGGEACSFVYNNWSDEQISELPEGAQVLYRGLQEAWDLPEIEKLANRMDRLWRALVIEQPLIKLMKKAGFSGSNYGWEGHLKKFFGITFELDYDPNGHHSVFVIDSEGNKMMEPKNPEHPMWDHHTRLKHVVKMYKKKYNSRFTGPSSIWSLEYDIKFDMKEIKERKQLVKDLKKAEVKLVPFRLAAIKFVEANHGGDEKEIDSMCWTIKHGRCDHLLERELDMKNFLEVKKYEYS